MELFVLLISLFFLPAWGKEQKWEERCDYWWTDNVWRPLSYWVRSFTYILILVLVVVLLIGLVIIISWWLKLREKNKPITKAYKYYNNMVKRRGPMVELKTCPKVQVITKDQLNNDKFVSQTDIKIYNKSYTSVEINYFITKYNMLYDQFCTPIRFKHAKNAEIDQWKAVFKVSTLGSNPKGDLQCENIETELSNLDRLRNNFAEAPFEDSSSKESIWKPFSLKHNLKLSTSFSYQPHLNSSGSQKRGYINSWVEETPTVEPSSTMSHNSSTSVFHMRAFWSPTAKLRPIVEKVGIFEEDGFDEKV